MTYKEKLKDPRWQKKRLQIFERDEWACKMCCSTTKTLQVHHVRYYKNCDPWDYDDADLVTLCESCHEAEHGIACRVQEVESVHEFLLPAIDEPNVIISINQQIHQLTSKLKDGVEVGLEADILKNLMFLYKTKNDLLNPNYNAQQDA
jgi:hypothetical protein